MANRQWPIANRQSPMANRQSPIRLAVADRGPGIPADEHARIFEPFYRRGSELRRETPGIGIGLSIVKHIVEAHGGCVSVHSQPGQGSRFVITLPADGMDRETPSSKLL
jgi:signal transduction histidine kinase